MALDACAALANRTSFHHYIATARNLTDGTFHVSGACQETVCTALYGTGNPDLDGVGMITGYLTSNALALLFTLILLVLERQAPYSMLRQIMLYGVESFYDCAVFFTFSVQIAATIMLSKVDYGLNSSGVEDTTVREIWAVSIITMIPLAYGAFIPQIFRLQPEESSSLETERGGTSVSTDWSGSGNKEGPRKQQLRFLLFVVCWMFSVYHFFSRMIESFASHAIGHTRGAVISTQEWYILTSRCWAHVHDLTDSEKALMNGFGITASLLLSLATLAKLASIGLRRNFPEILALKILLRLPHRRGTKVSLIWTSLLVLPLVAASQFWTLFRLRAIARQRAEVTTGGYASNSWTFGQVVSVTIFVPVLVTCCFQWLHIHRSR